MEDCVPKKSIRVFPISKLWMNQEIHSLVKTRRATLKSGGLDQYRKSRYDLHKAIREAKGQYRAKLEAQAYQTDSRCLWQGLNDIMGYKMKQCVTSRARRSCVDQLAEIFTDIFNLSLQQAKVPTCFKKTTIDPIPKKTHAVWLNDYRPIALTSIITKCFEKLVMAHINSSLSTCLNSLQFVYQFNSKTKELIIIFRKNGGEHAPIYINGAEVERVKSIKFLGVTLTCDLSWTSQVNVTVKK
eukprot:g34782.t1